MSKGLIIAVSLLSAQLPVAPGPRQVPSALLRAAAQDPLVFVMLMAEASVPAGLDVRSADQLPRGRPDFHFERSPTVGAAELVAAFNARHADYTASLMDGVFVIRPVGRTAAYLDAESLVGRVNVTGIMSAARTVFAPLTATVGAAGGKLGSSMVDATQAGDYAAISLDGEGRRVIDLLNQIVQQSPRAWVVVTSDDREDPRVMKFGFMHRGGALSFADISHATGGSRCVAKEVRPGSN